MCSEAELCFETRPVRYRPITQRGIHLRKCGPIEGLLSETLSAYALSCEKSRDTTQDGSVLRPQSLLTSLCTTSRRHKHNKAGHDFGSSETSQANTPK